MTTKTGIRVVRGPDWSHGTEDGGEGYLGTVISIPGRGPSYGKVHVVWDNAGDEKSYFAGKDGKFDLRIYDIASIGVKHKSVTCDACKTEGVAGIRWKCFVCTDYDLCSPCYYNDRHDKTHAFLRFVTDDCLLVKVPPRSFSTKKEVYGLVKGAEVVRGLHWNFGNQDGGPGKKGKITDVGTFTGGHYRGGVRVRWDHQPDNQLGYKVGAEGKVDLIAKSKTSGGTYYPEHIPRLDVVNPDHIHLKKSDKVKVAVDLDLFKKIQKEHQSGWNDGMKQCCEESGTIVAMPHPTVIRVQYEDARIWNLVRCVLQRVASFRKGDSVRITDSYNAAVELQVGHGGWNEKMEEALGKTGRILDIDNDGDLRIEVDGYRWLFSPASCTVQYDNNKQKPPTINDDITNSVLTRSQLPNPVESTLENPVMEFLQAAEQGDLEKVKSFLAINKDKINKSAAGCTALHYACYSGNVDIVKFLLDNGAGKDLVDNEGDTPLHKAVENEQDSVVRELCKRGVNKDIKNKERQTPLHRAVLLELEGIVSILVDNGADVNTQSENLETPMHNALKMSTKKPQIIKTLLDCDKLNASLANKDKLNVLHVAVMTGEQRVVEVLIERDQKLASVPGGIDNWTPLHIAAINGRSAEAGILVKKGGVDVNTVDRNKRTPLHYAVQCSDKADYIVDLLLGRDANPNIQDIDGNTPAHLAQMPKLSVVGARTEKDVEDVCVQSVLCMLAESQANLSLLNKAGKTPLDLCSKWPQLVQQLQGIALRVGTHKKDTDGIPPHWTSMKGQNLWVQELLLNDVLTAEEYKRVSAKFVSTMANVEILSIKRIQNQALWAAYNTHKHTLERTYGLGCANEQTLFHGTPAASIEAIQHQNIDPLLAGSNVGAIWGKGAYFALDAKQSDNYASASDEGFRFMYMARVLAGRYKQGSKGMNRPPPVNDSNTLELCDSVVDDPNNPRIFVIFRNQQIYPEFLIQYM